MPEIPLSVGSKLELHLRDFVFSRFLYTSTYTHAFVRVCILPSVYMYVYVPVHSRICPRMHILYCRLYMSILAIYHLHNRGEGTLCLHVAHTLYDITCDICIRVVKRNAYLHYCHMVLTTDMKNQIHGEFPDKK